MQQLACLLASPPPPPCVQHAEVYDTLSVKTFDMLVKLVRSRIGVEEDPYFKVRRYLRLFSWC